MRLALSLFVFTATLMIIACTNLDLDPVSQRFDDNFSGAAAHPGNIDPAGTNVFSFAVLSDTHVGSPGGRTINSILDRVSDEGDAFVLLCGDVTDTGQEEQYSELKNLFLDKGITFRSAIGNHDIFFGGWTQFKRFIGRSIYSFNADNVHVTVIDSANGVLGERQLSWIERDLQEATQEHKIVISHFPPWNGSFGSLYKMASEEESAILKDILHRTGVKIMFSGHYHGHNEIEIGGVKYIVTGGANDLIDIGNSQHYFRVHVNGSIMTTEYIPY